MQIILRRTKDATVTVSEALTALRVVRSFNLLHQSGNNLLADLDPAALPALVKRLKGWIVSPMGQNAPVPSARLKLRSTPEERAAPEEC